MIKGTGRALVLAAGLVSGASGVAAAQTPEPIGRFAADVRVVFPGYPKDAVVATALAVDPLSLPGRGRGLLIGGHVYPVRSGVVTFGLGAEWLTSRGRKALPLATDPDTDGPEVETRFSTFSPQVSLNFGARQGWSYLTAGVGRGHLASDLVEAPLSDPAGVQVLNYGGGARWFAKEHVALSLDLRFYAVGAQAATGTRPSYPRSRLLVLSAGVSFK